MSKFLAITLTALATLAGLTTAGENKEKGKKVDYLVYSSYFESNKAGLKGAESFLVFTDAKAFNKVFGKAVVMKKKPKFLPEDAFDSQIVVAAIKRGGDIWTYKVEKVTAQGDRLHVHYRTTAKEGGGAKFASPLVVAVDKGKYAAVVFIENGKKVGTAEVGK
jgi:competence protein ComGF